MHSLSVDLETKILNDLDDKFVALTRVGMKYPELIKVKSKSESKNTPELEFSYNILYTLAHGFHIRQREVVGDNDGLVGPDGLNPHFNMARDIIFGRITLN